MPWFAAHVVMYFKRTAAPQARYTVWENVHVIEAADMASARAHAEALGRREAGDGDGTLREVDDEGEHPVALLFAGVRKVVTVAHESEDGRLGSGDEVTYSEFTLASEEAVRRLAAGAPMPLVYTDR